jgi:hypothetical protein
MTHDPHQVLKDLAPQKEFFVGIDSDGCAFDTMEIKHKECFCPNTIMHWNLQVVSKYARDAWDFANLYSKTRGANRFLTLIQIMDLLRDRKEVQARNAKIPDLTSVIEWTKKESKLGNPALVMKESLVKLSEKADAMVVSSTPVEALKREWEENDMDGYMRLICGQEYGSKKEHLAYAAKGKYPDNHILMIGDAPGDMKAARANGVLFYPINPGHEEDSWERFYNEALDKFFNKEYEGAYEAALVEEFESYLPEIPPWKL